MKKLYLLLFTAFIIILSGGDSLASKDIPANHPYIQYFGRWSFTDSLAPAHSWPGVYLIARFQGTSLGVKFKDNYTYYNIFVDDSLVKIFLGNSSSLTTYPIIKGLKDTVHTLMITKRSESWTSGFTFNGLVLDDGKDLAQPPALPVKKIEFIGDSYTSASGNEYTKSDAPADGNPYTNVYLGFGPITARHYGAQYQVNSRSGFGMVEDYLGSVANNVPDIYDRTIINSSTPKWDFTSWKPNLVVICLGLNDYSGFGGYNGGLTQDETDLYKTRYHSFIARIRSAYRGVKILAVAAHLDWMQTVIPQIVQEEKTAGHGDVFYTYFPKYPDTSYVNNGHPNVYTHFKIADRLIAAIDSIDAWTPYNDFTAPRFINIPDSIFTVYDTVYTMKVKTDFYSTVRYSATDKPFDQMENTFTITGKADHSVVLSVKHNKTYKYYLRAKDELGNVMTQSAVITFKVDTTKELLNWKQYNYNTNKWKTGVTPIGVNAPTTPVTTINPVTTAYFRKKLSISNPDSITGFALLVKGYEAETAYLNGTEIDRINISKDTVINYYTLGAQPQNVIKVTVINAQNWKYLLRKGENIIAVEMHAAAYTNPRLSFDSQFYDSGNKIYYPLGSQWEYYDAGQMPADQLQDKLTAVKHEQGIIPDKISLSQNYPNPFNPETNISFELNKRQNVELNVLNILGQKISSLLNREMAPGKYTFTFDGSRFASGIYFYQLKAGTFNQIRKMLLLK